MQEQILPTRADEELVLSEHDVVITRTDVQGRIVYANETFLRTSGYTREEAIGRPQSLVRHPDTPREIFRDLWETIACDQPWTGVLKNRRKNGQFYRVVANVTPVFEDGVKVGYMSVCTRPAPELIAEADALYAVLNGPRGSAVRLAGGEVLRTGAGAAVERVLRLPVDLRLWAVMVFLIAMFAAQALGMRYTLIPGLARDAQVWLFGVLGALSALAAGIYLTREVLAPLKALNATALGVLCGHIEERFAERGDAQVRKLGRMLNQMNAKLVGILIDAKLSIDVIQNAAQEFANGTADLANRTDEQASAIEQTTASLAEITETAQRNAAGAERANATGHETAESAEAAAREVQRTVDVMAQVRDHAHRIAEITSLIDGIAFQTNIIALNASVEAARAGQYGRGFSVVATEVRSLAQRAAQAAKEIKGLVDSSLDTVGTAAQAASRAGETMGTVEQFITRLTETLREIATASRNQSAQIAQINEAVSQVAELTQRNAALVEQSAAASVGLRQQTESLDSAVSVFHLHDGEAGAVPAAPARHLAA
ncbi:methyl-accepting chemotaxis protein [Trinickia caryophylli]|uniref:Methyl-accepting chemotaxis sensory transducer with Pas/Pac sensor n=1 Tax=Trinickia caryophylli TaxID=28094 RepID=A0A1X7DNH3_TRICW|nr:methyl-accepting chemotaxis protein [Trinickia caryophylli]PMS10625.1 PAS domain S-box protein [Trinickia caryophylli]TRX17197.1 PAS domain-containing protein [Trinickia caryophylli]WQE12068.1 methyl-accepting chemotaxis protein [Trinickia caryophylli]SMF18559.1 methyl-accepting chemotaxis sensory transducer with Pas/Pac sensor [Trinickia caryophylli]GLU31808.1 methyl-accepting chemotaxis protein [Trinickia caryophylli]